ncbi:MAG: hypothetical protein K0B08_12050 [Bacteroidales bacterium]|nr:hypothetical protein [Bacteroidales bacterium]
MNKMTLSGIALMATISFASSCQFRSGSLLDAVTGASLTIAQDGNSLFHQTDALSLTPGEIEIAGEVKKGGMVDFKNHYKREVVMKEAIPDENGNIQFKGAYRYIGYTLFDLLHPFIQDKKNAALFRPAIDLYVVIQNIDGESVVFSWSEIFHTTNPHQIMIATEAAPIKPYRKEVDYQPGSIWKVVAASDLYAYRELINPATITVRSFDKKDYVINRDLDSANIPAISIVVEDELLPTIQVKEDRGGRIRYYTTFYGMGMGYHESEYFEGYALRELLEDSPDIFNSEWNRSGLVCFAGVDGYRAIYSFAELFNRADQSALILTVPDEHTKCNGSRVFLPVDFYADRSVKLLAEIYFFREFE